MQECHTLVCSFKSLLTKLGLSYVNSTCAVYKQSHTGRCLAAVMFMLYFTAEMLGFMQQKAPGVWDLNC